MTGFETRDDFLTLGQEFYIKAASSLADDRKRVLKYGETFAVFNRFGDIESAGPTQFGLFYREARHLSRFSFYLDGRKLLLLSSSIREDNSLLLVDATNLTVHLPNEQNLPQGSVHVFRSTFVTEAACEAHFRFHNYSKEEFPLNLLFVFDADFADIFQVRGTPRAHSGRHLEDRTDERSILMGYVGLDGVVRETRISFSLAPQQIRKRNAIFAHNLAPRSEWSLSLTVTCERSDSGDGTKKPKMHSARTEESPIFLTKITTSNKGFNSWLARSQADLLMLMEGNPESQFPYAGVPWFSTVFGRDGIITALECLWNAPSIARSVLSYLADTQATAIDAARDAEPGKIIHEIRRGEMAVMQEVPFRRYYGSVDSTPLFLILAGSYYERTGDLELIEQKWPNIEAALRWIDEYADVDHDGFYEYTRRSEKGLLQQGWKDSGDSIFHRDGQLAQAPIALCEMQGYVYAAKKAIGKFCQSQNMETLGNRLLSEAEALRERFNSVFWNAQLKTFALALDGEKRPCLVRASNAGHALFAEIAAPEYAAILAETLFDSASFSGWGIRTVAAWEPRYNPMSYHNGSVWPHDNALIGMGFRQYGWQHLAARLLGSMFEASLHVDLHRLPELFCGFHRRWDGTGPTRYPVACAPQAWSAGAVFLLLSACLGLRIKAEDRSVTFENPNPPEGIDQLQITGIKVGEAVIDVLVQRNGRDCEVQVQRKLGDVNVVITPVAR
jgi:glycogen debranching enzyme